MSDRRMSVPLILVGGLCLVLSCAPEDPEAPSNTPRSLNEALNLPPQPQPAPAARPTSGLQARIEEALRHVRQRDLRMDNAFWTIFHGILGVGPDVTLLDPATGKHVNALEHICSGGHLRGLQFIPTAHGLDVQIGPTFVGQGHQDQFVAEMAQWGMTADQTFKVHGKEYKFQDFINHSRMRARVTQNQELSWAIIMVAQFYGTDHTWTNAEGEKLHFEDVVRYELNQPIDEAACGGTHRLFGLTWAYHLHMARGGKKTQVWQDVENHNKKYAALAKKYQNPDGSFSTTYLASPANNKDLDRRVNTTGHVLEWLALALSDEELKQSWVQEAANALSLMILDSANAPIDSGSLYHATHGLHIYYARLWGRSSVTHPGLLYPLPPKASATAKR